MKIRLLSDIHTEFYRDGGWSLLERLPSEGVDVAVIAGDLTTKNFHSNLNQLCDKFPKVVYVAGNHDFWHKSFQETRDIIGNVAAKLSNLYFLDNTRVTIDGVSFIGSTLWFPKPKNYDSDWSDFHLVEDGPEAIFKEHAAAVEFFKNNMQQGDVLVTHHLPSWQCVDLRWMGDSYNEYFVGSIEDLIRDAKPKLALHGHSHDPLYNLKIHDTTFFRIPLGYPREGVLADTAFVIDTDKY